MSEINAGKRRVKRFRVLAGVCVALFVVCGVVYFYNNGFNSAHWPKKAGLGVDIDEALASENHMVPKSEKDNFKDIEIETFSQVNLLRREYKRGFEDLKVKVSGGEIVNWRLLRSNNWLIGPSRKNMSSSSSGKSDLNFTKKGKKVARINWGGVNYSSADEKTWKYGKEHKITKKDKGYRWENKSKEWMDFDESGRMESYGGASGTLGKLLYDGGKISGIADRKGNQVIWYEYNKGGLVSSLHDKANRRVEYSYTKDGLLASATDVMGYKTSFEYDRLGRLVKTIEPLGKESIVTYDEYGDIASNVDGNGIGFFFEFDYDKDADEYYARVEHSSGKVKEIWYDSTGLTKRMDINGRTVKTVKREGNDLIITENGHETVEEYDESDNLIRTIHPDGSEVSYEYDKEFNQVTRKIDEAGVATEFKYNNKGDVTKRIEASGTKVERVTEYSYDEDGNVISIKRLGDANAAETITTMKYDVAGNIVSETDPEGNITRYTYDIMGNVLTKTNAKGKGWKYERDAMGREISSKDPHGIVTKKNYDESGNVTKEIDSRGIEKNFEYDENDNLVSMTDALGSKTILEYDNTCGKVSRITDPEGSDIYYSYDSECREVIITDGSDQITKEYDGLNSDCPSCSGNGSEQPSRIIYPTFTKEYTYDARGRTIEELDILSDTDSYFTEYVYDSRGNLIKKIDNEGNITTNEYDELNRLIKVIDPKNGLISYSYDSRDNMIALTDAENNTTRFEHDMNNRLIKEIMPMGSETTYAYDATGELIQKVDAKGQKIERQYDVNGRLEEIRYYNSVGDVNPIKVVSYSYDNKGNLTGYDDGITSALYEYDKLNRKTSETINYGLFNRTNTYTYYNYLNGGQKKTFTGPDGLTNSYSYNKNMRLTSLEIPNEGKLTFNDYLWKKPRIVNFPGGVTMEYTIDPLMRVESITSMAGKGKSKDVILDYQYGYDKIGNITAKQTEHGEYDYGYDDLYRLTKVESPIKEAANFTYDAVGNRLTSAEKTEEWKYNSNNELLSNGNAQYSYDANGNMVKKTVDGVVTNYIYNIENRLSEVRNGSGSLISSYYYDPFGKRLWKEVDGIKTYFHYYDEGLIGEYDATGTELKTYGYKPGSNWTTDPLYLKEGGQIYFYHNDHLGIPQKLTAKNGAVVWSAKYTAFGKAEIDNSSIIKSNLRFSGQYEDEETGLHYNHWRYYDPEIGRYIRTDPIGLNGGTNLYVYANNNPMKFIDPNGKWPVCCPAERSQCEMRCAAFGGVQSCHYWYIPIPVLWNIHFIMCECRYTTSTDILQQKIPICETALASCLSAPILDAECYNAYQKCIRTPLPMIFPGYGTVPGI